MVNQPIIPSRILQFADACTEFQKKKNVYLRHSKLQDKMDGAYGTYVSEVYSKFWSENLVEKGHLEDKGFVGLDLKVRMWSKFIWLRTGTSWLLRL
jgi:hypothetical protein